MNSTFKNRDMAPTGPIIIVEDDEDDRFILSEVCHNLEVANEIKFFVHGQHVLNYLRVTTDKPFIILCDINMPEMSGLELRQLINDEEQLRQKSIPFVFFSTAATIEQVKRAYELTVQGFFIKEGTFSGTESTIKLILDYWAKCRHPNI